MKSHLYWLLGYVLRNKWTFLLSILVICLETISSLSLTGIQKWIIDDVFIHGHEEKLYLYLGLFFGLSTFYILFNILSAYMINLNQAALYLSMSNDLISSIYKLPIRKLQNERTAKYVHYFTEDLQQTSNTGAQVLLRGLQQFVSLVFLIMIIGYFSVSLLFASLIFSIVYTVLGRYFSPRLREVSRAIQDQKSSLLVQLEEGVSATREVIAYNRIDWEKTHYWRFFNQYLSQVMREGRLTNLKMITSDPLKWAGTLVVLGFGGYMVMKGDFTLGTFVILYQYNTRMMQSIRIGFNLVMDLSSRMAHIDRVRPVLEEGRDQASGMSLNGPINRIEFANVSFQYDKNLPKVLEKVSFEIPIGKKTAFVGLSGGGKSTIAQLLIRFYKATTGEIRVNEMPLDGINLGDWRQKVAIVFQEPYLFPGKIIDNLLLGKKNVSMDSLIEACRIAQIHDFIQMLPQKYDTEIGERGVTLSGGERQRLALARAMIDDPEILILDEATSSLDQETERLVQQQLDEKRMDKTTIIIAHRLSTIQNAEWIYVMDRGEVAEQGTHRDLMESGVIYPSLVLAHDEQKSVDYKFMSRHPFTFKTGDEIN